ncbi:GNAT family N-acetyltransferase [Paenibacillus pini]|nr:GNAT family N-acetyltransferase [Paenibacillus pini]
MKDVEPAFLIRELRDGEIPPMELLLLADSEITQVMKYRDLVKWLIVEQNEIVVGVCGVMEIEPDNLEIMNIAVDPDCQGQGYAKRLIGQVMEMGRTQGYKRVWIRTGNSSLNQLALYQKCGFRMVRIERDHFIKHYQEMIYENGIWCRDQVILEAELSSKYCSSHRKHHPRTVT